MTRFGLVVFDLDGTLIDSAGDIARAANELRSLAGRKPLPVDRVKSYIGDGVRRLVERALPRLDESALDEAVVTYRAIYRKRLLDTTRPYEGARTALRALADGGVVLAVLTNKPRRESEAILDGLELSEYFATVYGGDSFPRNKPDPEGLLTIVREHRLAPEATLFVGDSPVDQRTSAAAGTPFCLARYGMSAKDAAELPAQYRIGALAELPGLVLPAGSESESLP